MGFRSYPSGSRGTRGAAWCGRRGSTRPGTRSASWPGQAPAAVGEDVVHHRRADEERQELVQDQPVVVPQHEALRLREDGRGIDESELRADVIDRLVMEEDERAV